MSGVIAVRGGGGAVRHRHPVSASPRRAILKADERPFRGKGRSDGKVDSEQFGQKIAPLNADRVANRDDGALVHEREHVCIARREVEVVQDRKHSDALVGDRPCCVKQASWWGKSRLATVRQAKGSGGHGRSGRPRSARGLERIGRASAPRRTG